MSESLWRTSLAECRERFKELGKNCRLCCRASVDDGDSGEGPSSSHLGEFVAFSCAIGTLQTVYGSRDGWSRFRDIAGLAFLCLEGSPLHVRKLTTDYQLPPFGIYDNAWRWLHTVLELALRKFPGSPLHVEQIAWKGRHTVPLHSLPGMRKELAAGRIKLPDFAELPTGRSWFIELKDLANSSVAAIDILLSQAVNDADPMKTRREALHLIGDIIDDVDATKPPVFPLIELRPLFEQLAALAALSDMPPPVEFIGEGLSVSLILRGPNGARQEILVRRDMMHKRTPFYEDRFNDDARKQLFACLGKWKRRLEEPLEAVDLEQKKPSLKKEPNGKTRKPTKAEKIRRQRNKFSRPRLKKNETWPEIYDAYHKRYPDDKKASADTLRHSHERDPDQTDNSDT